MIISISLALELDNHASTLSLAIAASHIPVSINNCSVGIPLAFNCSITYLVRASASGWPGSPFNNTYWILPSLFKSKAGIAFHCFAIKSPWIKPDSFGSVPT